ncbi:hypothetical protein HPB50_010030 [Hyalomma asiaticum]|uniref:Uncharacterized protein n=1 Tax=Hyalomma asiaticum TaxID=266040 RepID=A0ACB7SXK7_HYAAI|nr:hypothetical protein HPB50_010030 [Hyalomma asiaticum]
MIAALCHDFATGSLPLEPSPGVERQLSRGAAAVANGPSPVVVVVAVACLVALLLPLEEGASASSSSHPFLQLNHQQKLIAAYILGVAQLRPLSAPPRLLQCEDHSYSMLLLPARRDPTIIWSTAKSHRGSPHVPSHWEWRI